MARRYINYNDPRRVLNAKYGESHPDCFDNATAYRQYMWFIKEAASPKDRNYCLDCNPEHKSKMLAEGRCEHPETRFVVWVNKNREPEMIGVSNMSRFWHRVVKGESVFNWGEDGEDK